MYTDTPFKSLSNLLQEDQYKRFKRNIEVKQKAIAIIEQQILSPRGNSRLYRSRYKQLRCRSRFIIKLMNLPDQEELEAWLAEVELVSEKIKKLATQEAQAATQQDDEEIMKLRKKREEHEKLKRDKERQIQEEQERQILQGRKGKGEKKDYINFCKWCFREYLRPTETCYHCKRPTQSQEERYTELLQKVQQMKEDKQRKQEKKQKYELMQKTQKMLWKKNSTNYNKWEYYTSSEDEIETEPVVPRDDPNFRALELDLEQRRQKRLLDAQKAEELKLKGNTYFANREYEHAVWKYSEALELVKDNKVLWLNRAIAYIKLGKFRKAMRDCTKVIEFAECFENGFTQSRESCFKAFLRRAVARKSLKQYQEAMLDVEEALKLCPEDKEAIHLRLEIQEETKLLQKVQKIKEEENLPFKEVIDKFISGAGNQDLLQLLSVFRKDSEEAIVYFFDKQGLGQLIKVIESDTVQHDEQNLMASLPALLLQMFQEKSILYQEHFLTQCNGIDVILTKVRGLLRQAADKRKSAIYDAVQDYLECLNLLDDEKIRALIQSNSSLQSAIYPELFERITPLFKTEIHLVAAYLSLTSNLCYGNSPLKGLLIQHERPILTRLGEIFNAIQPQPQFQQLYDQTCNLFSNLLTEASFRAKAHKKEYEQLVLSKLYNVIQTQMNQENAAAVLVNLTYQIEQPLQKQITPTIVPVLLDMLNSQNQTVVERALIVLAKTQHYKNILQLVPYLQKQPNAALKALIQMTNCCPKEELRTQLEQPQVFELLGALKQLILRDVEQIFCNACHAVGVVVDAIQLRPVVNDANPCSYFQQIIPHLITIARDKRGNMRKNAAILLAKLSKDAKNLETLRSLHGIEILHSIIGFVL